MEAELERPSSGYVRDHYGCPSSRDGLQGLLYSCFCLRVQSRGCFVQHQDLWSSQERPCNGNLRVERISSRQGEEGIRDR